MGEKIRVKDGKLVVPDNPVIPYIEGDGVGPDITRAAMRVFNAAVERAYKGKRKIEWLEIYAGEKGVKVKGELLPEETVNAIREHIVAIKGPLTTPVGGGYRSLDRVAHGFSGGKEGDRVPERYGLQHKGGFRHRNKAHKRICNKAVNEEGIKVCD